MIIWLYQRDVVLASTHKNGVSFFKYKSHKIFVTIVTPADLFYPHIFQEFIA